MMSDVSVNLDDFLEHYGVLGMKWGVRRTNNRLQKQAASADKRTTQGKTIQKMASESKRIADAGGGVKGTLKVRREMVKTGELSKSDLRKGNVQFGAALTAAILVGGAAGAGIGNLLVKSLK